MQRTGHTPRDAAGDPDRSVRAIAEEHGVEPAPPSLVTFGHGTASQEAIARLLAGAGIEMVVDVRTAPGSRRHPHVARRELELWLPAAGIGYRWEPRLGGFRRSSPDSPDIALRDESFRGYAGWMRTGEFREAMSDLLEEADRRRVATMCSESVWWRCHRRLIADFATLVGRRRVVHLFHDGRLQPHQTTEGVRAGSDGLLVYAPPPPAEEGGDPACWMDRLCPDCGAFIEQGAACRRCGGRPEGMRRLAGS